MVRNKADSYGSAGHEEESFVFFLYLSPHFYKIIKENESMY